jgi:hypothetical protein
LIISPDPVAYEAALYRDSSSPAYRIAASERSFMLRQMRQRGVQIVNWQVTEPLETIIREALALQPLIAHSYRMWMG